MDTPKRGEIWLVNWNQGRGSEQADIRPFLIIQSDAGNINTHYPNTIVLTISTKSRMVPFHIHIKPSAENGLKEEFYIKCEQILTISKERLVKKLGTMEAGLIEQVEEALQLVLDLKTNCQ